MSEHNQTPRLSHVNQQGEANMVDVTAKAVTSRTATAEGYIRMTPETLHLITEGEHKKGDVFAVARIAGIQAAKRTGELIPLCHPLPLDHVDLSFEVDTARCAIRLVAEVSSTTKTGVEMEALTAVSIAALTVYDMCKAVDRAMSIESIALVEKSGGKSGHFVRDNETKAGDT